MLEKVGKTEKTTDDNYTEFVVNFNKQQVYYIYKLQENKIELWIVLL